MISTHCTVIHFWLSYLVNQGVRVTFSVILPFLTRDTHCCFRQPHRALAGPWAGSIGDIGANASKRHVWHEVCYGEILPRTDDICVESDGKSDLLPSTPATHSLEKLSFHVSRPVTCKDGLTRNDSVAKNKFQNFMANFLKYAYSNPHQIVTTQPKPSIESTIFKKKKFLLQS